MELLSEVCENARKGSILLELCNEDLLQNGFAFTTKNVSDLFSFTVTLLDGSGNKITFPANKTKVPTI